MSNLFFVEKGQKLTHIEYKLCYVSRNHKSSYLKLLTYTGTLVFSISYRVFKENIGKSQLRKQGVSVSERLKIVESKEIEEDLPQYGMYEKLQTEEIEPLYKSFTQVQKRT